MNTYVDDPNFPGITYRFGASGIPTPVLRGTGIRVQTTVIANVQWNESPEIIASQYDLPVSMVEEALAFYQAHQDEVDLLIQAEAKLAKGRNDSLLAP